MRKVTLLVAVLSVLLWSCGGDPEDQKKNISNLQEKAMKAAGADKEAIAKMKEVVENSGKSQPKYPEGYPTELPVPPGFKASKIMSGSGEGGRKTIDQDDSLPFGKPTTFNSYTIWESRPKNAPEIISHYKKLLTDLGYAGEWKGDGVKKSARGVFKKGQNELELKISTDQFKFDLKVWAE